MGGMQLRAAWSSHAMPTDAAIGMPQRHGMAAKGPYNRTQCGQPVGAKHHVVAAQR